jgi:integrating conjugative element protein (TIGR03752 family)
MTMNKLLPLLVIVVFLALGALLFMSRGDDRPVTQTTPIQSSQASSSKMPQLSEADRDTYLNTIKTMSARNNELISRMEKLEATIRDQERKKSSENQNIERMINKTIEERASGLTKSFSQKFDQIQRELKDKKRQLVNAPKPSGIPAGLGLDDLKRLPLGRNRESSSPPDTVSLDEWVTITPVTTIGFSSEGGHSIPLSIIGEPLEQEAVPARRSKKSSKKEVKPPVPYFTIPQNATLFSNDTLTALLGIVPNTSGSVLDPIRFKIITGDINMATNRQFLPPGIKDIVWSGIAIGNREMSCVRGEVHSVTFTFEDGTIRTVNSQTDSGRNSLGGKMLGYIATRQGNPCLPGTLITNAQDYLMDRMLGSGAAALASGFAETQKTTTQNSDGSTTSFFSGDKGEYMAGQTLAGSLSELTSYLRERQRNAVDLVYLDAGAEVVLHVESQIEIDYEPEGRKLNYAHNQSDRQGYRLD